MVLCASEAPRVNWDAIGALAELVGGVAVVITLFFLAFQIRHNSKAIAAQLTHDFIESSNQIRSSIYTDAELTRIWVRGSEGGDLDLEEYERFEQMARSWFFLLVDLHRQCQNGYLKISDFNGMAQGILQRPGVRAVILRFLPDSNEEFSVTMRKLIAEAGGA